MAAISYEQYSFLLEKRFLLEKPVGSNNFVINFMSKYPTVFTKKSKINTHGCGYMLDLTRLVCPALQSHHLIIQKHSCSFFPVKIEMLYESCTNIFLFQSHINFDILTHFLNANFEKSLQMQVLPKRKFLLIIKANAKNWDFFNFPFSSDRLTLQILEKIHAPGN